MVGYPQSLLRIFTFFSWHFSLKLLDHEDIILHYRFAVAPTNRAMPLIRARQSSRREGKLATLRGRRR